MEIRPFKMQDYVVARLANGVGLEYWGLKMGVAEVLFYMERSGSFWTLWDGVTVVLIAGWHRGWGRVCEVSLFPTERFVSRPVGALLRLKKELRKLVRVCDRVQLTCKKEKLFTKFAQRLGFQVEGILRNYGPGGQDHVMMSIVGEAYA